MRPPGLASSRPAAKADDWWAAAYQSQRNATVPPDLAAALDRDDRAKAVFESLGRSERYAVTMPLLRATPQQLAERLESHDGQARGQRAGAVAAPLLRGDWAPRSSSSRRSCRPRRAAG
jgi:Bacteriocin-protection, YdeI or OmpD-Associated